MQNIPIFVINLKKDIEKKKHMETLCKQHQLSCQFTDAIYGKELNENDPSKVYNKEESISAIGRELTKGEIGCALSHINIYKQMVEQNIEKAIIFEDDIQIEDDFHSLIALSDKFPDDWELVLLGYFQRSTKDDPVKSSFKNRIKITTKHKLVKLVDRGKGTHGYMINIRGAKRLLGQLSIIKKPIDLYTGNDRHINLYAISPRPVRLHNIFSEQSTLEEARKQRRTNSIKKPKTKIHLKLKKELFRPFKQLLDRIILPKEYT